MTLRRGPAVHPTGPSRQHGALIPRYVLTVNVFSLACARRRAPRSASRRWVPAVTYICAPFTTQTAAIRTPTWRWQKNLEPNQATKPAFFSRRS